jgi:alkylation response protein AidB-like acyl-CoA dehydrogenase
MQRELFQAVHDEFRERFTAFLESEVVPHYPRWELDGILPRALFGAAGRAGFLAWAVPEEYGGQGVDDFRFNTVLAEEAMRVGATGVYVGFALQNDVTLPYYLRYASQEQKRRWLPGIASGELICAIAMTEPGTGSDLAAITTTAIADGDSYVVSGSKLYIGNGINADVVIVAAKTDPTARHRGISLLVVERGMPGFERGRNLDKIGIASQDTAELFFNDVRVPRENLLGEEGKGFGYLVSSLAQERMSVAVMAIATAEAALSATIDYVRERHAFGQTIGTFQNSRFALAEIRTEIDIAQAFVDRCVISLNAGKLSGEDAAKAKWWCSELQGRALDRCVQLHGGHGFMRDCQVARAWADSRITRIYGGTTEIMKEIIGRSIGL